MPCNGYGTEYQRKKTPNSEAPNFQKKKFGFFSFKMEV